MKVDDVTKNLKIKDLKIKKVKPISNTSHVYLPADWSGKNVLIILLDEENQDKKND